MSKKRKAEEPPPEEPEDPIFPFSLPQVTPSLYSTNNHVYFNDDITYTTMFALSKELRQTEKRLQILALNHNFPVQPIYLHVTTYGGDIHAAFSVVDTITSLKLPVYTVADGFVASAGTLITLAGTKRYVTPNAYMLIHELRSGIWGKMTSISEEYSNLQKVMDHIIEFYLQHTNLTRKQLEKILTKDLIWNAQECIEKSLVQEIYSSDT